MNKTLSARVNIADPNSFNPYVGDKGSLAYNLINNAIALTSEEKEAGYAELRAKPLTTPAVSASTLYNKVGEEATSESNVSINTTYQKYYWTYGTGYTVDPVTGKFTLTGVSTCQYNDGTCHETLVGKYILSTTASSNSNSTNTQKTTTNVSSIYKVTTAPASSTSTITMKAKKINTTYYSGESTLTTTADEYGTSYYYRGDVENNYVTFAGMCWRIVRIAGDGSVKIVLEDQDEVCSTSMNGNWGIPTTTGGTTYTGNYGYELKNVDSDSGIEYIMSYLKPVTNADKSMARAFYDFQKDKLEDYKSKLKSGNWCLADKAYTQSGSSPNYTYTLLEEYNYSSRMYYDSYVRLYGNSTKEPTLKCTGTIMDKFESVTYNETEIIEEAPMYVSALTADEIVYAGGKVGSPNGNFYLLNENFKSENAGYHHFWSLSPSYFGGFDDCAFDLGYDGDMGNVGVDDSDAFRPAVSLASSAVISSGEGTLEKPYIVE